MKYFIDTNIFLRTFLADDKSKFSDCIIFLSAIKENKFEACTATTILTEIAWTLKSYYQFSKDVIIRRIKSIINLSGLEIIDNYNHPLALQLYEKYSIKYIDALIASNEDIYTKKMTIVSYDRDFDKLNILRQEPKEVLKAIPAKKLLS